VRSGVAAALIVLAPCVVGAQTVPGDEPAARETRPFAALSNTALSMRDSVVAVARAQIGTPYKLGGTTPGRGFDCSGLVRYVLGALNLPLPRTAAQQAALGDAIPKDTTRLRPGDLLTFGKGKRVTHVGIDARRHLCRQRALRPREHHGGSRDRDFACAHGVAAGENVARRPARAGGRRDRA
jgi:hypothetical protein